MGSEFVVTSLEKDQDNFVDSSLKTQCAMVVKEGNSMLGSIKKRIKNRMENIVISGKSSLSTKGHLVSKKKTRLEKINTNYPSHVEI